MPDTEPQDVVGYWLAVGPARWFTHDAAFDAEIRRRLLGAHEAAAAGALAAWANEAEGALALVILLDQVPRNVFRGTARAFATDAAARALADRAIAAGFDRAFSGPARALFYLPFMHSEDVADQQRSLALHRAIGDDNGAAYAIIHRDIIARFGRFPHRNAVLGRATTPVEQRFLNDGGFAG